MATKVNPHFYWWTALAVIIGGGIGGIIFAIVNQIKKNKDNSYSYGCLYDPTKKDCDEPKFLSGAAAAGLVVAGAFVSVLLVILVSLRYNRIIITKEKQAAQMADPCLVRIHDGFAKGQQRTT